MMKRALPVLLLSALSSVPAQTATVHVHGTVTDSCGVRIPRATVMFIAGTDTTSALSDSLGYYELWLSDGSTGIHKEKPSPTSLSQNYPNPFNPSTTIEYTLDESRQVSLDIFSITGQRVRTLVSGVMYPGIHRVVWDGRDSDGNSVAAGVYLYRLVSGSQVLVKKIFNLLQ